MAHKNAPTPSVRAKSPIARASSNERSRSPLYSPGIDSPGIEARVQQLEEDDAGRQGISSPVWRSTLQRNVSSGIEIAEHMEDRLEAILHHPKTQRQPCNCFGVLGETCPVCEKETLQAVEQPLIDEGTMLFWLSATLLALMAGESLGCFPRNTRSPLENPHPSGERMLTVVLGATATAVALSETATQVLARMELAELQGEVYRMVQGLVGLYALLAGGRFVKPTHAAVVLAFTLQDLAALGLTWRRSGAPLSMVPWLLGGVLRSGSLLLAALTYVTSNESMALFAAALCGEVGGLFEAIDRIAAHTAPLGLADSAGGVATGLGKLLATPSYRRMLTLGVVVARLAPPPLAIAYAQRVRYDVAHPWAVGLVTVLVGLVWLHDLVWAILPAAGGSPLEEIDTMPVRVGGGGRGQATSGGSRITTSTLLTRRA